ncbi:MAG: hypothetical protein FWD26_00725 [Treponema sp.]|nr:hypothetical protein [Treponema sp.]
MAKISEQDRHTYQERSRVFSTMAKALLKEESDLLTIVKKNPGGTVLKKLTLVDAMLNLASSYMAINGVSMAVLKVKNEEALNDARKSMYKAVIYLEEVVSNYIDAPFSDYEEKLSAIESFDPNQRYNLIRKMGFAIDLLEQAYGDNSKWRWTFVEMEGRFAATAKNILDLRNAMTNSHPESPYYDSTVYHLRLIKELLSRAASRYRDKYELSTQQMLDFKTGILFLSALKRIHIVLSESEEAEEIKKKLNIWSTKLETDLKKQEEAKKRK